MIFIFTLISIYAQQALIETFRNSLLESGQATREKHVIVIDAGSTGTRLNIYGFIIPGNIISYYSKITINPGIHTLKKKNSIENYLQTIIENATQILAKSGISINNVPFVFQGTAGLRSLNVNDRYRLFKHITKVFDKYNLNLTGIDIISGYEEGLLALDSLKLLIKYNNNVLYDYGCKKDELKKYLNNISTGFCDTRVEKPKYHGIIDMGGGSVQIAYEFSPQDKYEDPIHVIHSFNKNIYINFFPGWGLNEGLKVLKTNKEYSLIGDDGRRITLFDKLLDDFRMNRKPDINNVDELYLLSYYYDRFKQLGCGTKTNIKEIKKLIDLKCGNNKISHYGHIEKRINSDETNEDANDFCDEVYYLYKFLDVQGLHENKMLILVSDIDGINMNWSLSRGVKMIKEIE